MFDASFVMLQDIVATSSVLRIELSQFEIKSKRNPRWILFWEEFDIHMNYELPVGYSSILYTKLWCSVYFGNLLFHKYHNAVHSIFGFWLLNTTYGVCIFNIHELMNHLSVSSLDYTSMN